MKRAGEKDMHSALIGKAVMSNTPGTGWAIAQFYPERALLYYISLYISTVLTLLYLPYHQLWRGPWVLCGQSLTLCAWSVPDWSQLKSISARTDTEQNTFKCTLLKLYGCVFYTKKNVSHTFGLVQFVQPVLMKHIKWHKKIFYTRRTRQICLC